MISPFSLVMVAALLGATDPPISLTQLMPHRISGGMGSIGLNKSYGSAWWPPARKPLKIGQRTFEHGLGTRAGNEISYRIDGRYRQFLTWVGIDAEMRDKPGSRVVFQVTGDGKVLFDSGEMTPEDPAKRVEVSVEEIQELKLITRKPQGDTTAGHADWAEPILTGLLPRTRVSDSRSVYQVRGGSLVVELDSKGRLSGIEFPKYHLNWPVDGWSEVEECTQSKTQAQKEGQGISFNRTLSRGVRLKESFQPAGEGILWQLEIQTEGQPWGGTVNTSLRLLHPEKARIWTAWGGGVEWTDPLDAWDFRTTWYEYGTFFNRDFGVSLPIFSILDRSHDVGLTLLQNFEDKLIKMNLSSDRDGTLNFSRYNLRMGEGRQWIFRVELLPHAADVRAALGATVARHGNYFEPPNPLASQVGGHGAYSSNEGELEWGKLKAMGFTYNWKASFDFPYMGMFLPPVRGGERWPRFAGESSGKISPGQENVRGQTSLPEMAEYSVLMRDQGFHVLNYFNVTEFGTGILFPPPLRKAADDENLWRDPNDYLHHVLSEAILRNPDPIYTWGDAVIVDCGDPVYRKFLLEQARRHIEELPASSGICIDRMDWLNQDNPHADDGLTWNEGPVRSLLNSWQELMALMGPLFHKANKVIFANTMIRRPDLVKEIDGIYDEHGDFGFSMNTTSFLALRKPATLWTRDENQLKPDPDAFMQKRLYMGVFLTAPVPGNDHTILPSPWVDRVYLDYGPMFKALRGRKWVLVPHVLEGIKPVLANLFEVPDGYVVSIGLAGSSQTVTLKLQNLDLHGFRPEAIVPGDANWKPISVTFEGSQTKLTVPVKRGGAMVRFIKP